MHGKAHVRVCRSCAGIGAVHDMPESAACFNLAMKGVCLKGFCFMGAMTVTVHADIYAFA